MNIKNKRLANGAIVLEQKGNKVLCVWGTEYVVWSVMFSDLSAYWGHYFQGDLIAATDYFNSL